MDERVDRCVGAVARRCEHEAARQQIARRERARRGAVAAHVHKPVDDCAELTVRLRRVARAKDLRECALDRLGRRGRRQLACDRRPVELMRDA